MSSSGRPSTSATSPTTPAPRDPARCSSASRARRATATTSRARRSRRGAVALVVERALDLAVPQLVVADVRAAMAAAADVFFGHPTDELAVAGVTGTNGKTTTAYLLHAILEAAGRRPGLRRHGRDARRRRAAEARRGRRPRRSTSSACSARCSTRATAARDGGVVARVRAAPARRRPRFARSSFTNLTQDHLDFHGTMEAYFEAKRRLFVADAPPRAAVNVGDEWGRRLAAELPGRAHLRARAGGADPRRAPRAHRRRRPLQADGIDLRTHLRGRFNVENVLAAVAARAAARTSATTRSRRASRRCRRARAVRARGRGAAVHGARRLRAHAGRARERRSRTARDLAEGRVLVRLRRRRRPRPREAAADGADRRRARRRRGRHVRQSAQRGSAGDRRRGRSPAPAATSRSSSTGAARSSGRSSRPAPGRRRRDRRQGPRAGAGDRRPRRSRSTTARSHARRCGAEGARVIPLTLEEVARLAPASSGRRAADRSRRSDRLAHASSPATCSSPSAAASGFVDDALARGAAAALVPDDAFAALAALGRARARPQRRRRRRDHRLDRQDLDEGHPRRALPPRRAHGRGRARAQQRDRRAAHALPARAGHGGLRHSSWGCAASARSPSSPRSRGRGSA